MIELTGKPWNRPGFEAPPEIFLPKGMLGDEERRCLYYLGRNLLTPNGNIIDAGAYIGSSGFCLAAGAARNPHRPTTRPVVHSYDYFMAFDEYVAAEITATMRPLGQEENYLDVYLFQTGMYKELVKPYAGDFLSYNWSGDPIDVCFIDVAKTQELNSHAIKQFFPSLKPGHSVVVQQDFYHCWHPYIHIGMEILGDYFDLVDGYVKWQSRVYQLREAIPGELIDRLAAWDVSLDEEVAMLDRFIAREEGDMKGMAHATKLWRLKQHGAEALYEAAWVDFVAAMPDWESSSELWASNARDVSAKAFGE